MRHSLGFLFLIYLIAGCQPYRNPLDGPTTISITGTGASVNAGNNYVFADSTGAIAAAGNTIQAVYSDTDVPLYAIDPTEVFTYQLSTGSCTSVGALVATVPPATPNAMTANFSATGCADQTLFRIYIDSSQVFDQSGLDGDTLIITSFTVDVAPKVATQATGNTAADGSGTTEASAGYFNLATDNSIVVKFSKALAPSQLAASISGCAATLGAGVLVSGSGGTIAAWPLGNLGGVSAGQSCTLDVSAVQDIVGNTEDPADSNATMNFTFH